MTATKEKKAFNCKERKRIIRERKRAMGDLNDWAKQNNSILRLDPNTGEEIQTLIKELMEQKREVIERVKKLLEN